MKDRADYQANKEISVFAASRIIKDVARGELKKRQGHKDLPLFMWLPTVCTGVDSPIKALLKNTTGNFWKWNTWGASSAVTAHRLAKKYRITYVQHAALEAYLSSTYRGRVRHEGDCFHALCGVYGEPQISKKAATSSLEYFVEVQRKAGFVNRHLPLRVLLSPVVTSLILSHQLRSVINESAKNNARTARGSRVHHGRVDQRGCEAGRGPIGAECSHPNH